MIYKQATAVATKLQHVITDAAAGFGFYFFCAAVVTATDAVLATLAADAAVAKAMVTDAAAGFGFFFSCASAAITTADAAVAAETTIAVDAANF